MAEERKPQRRRRKKRRSPIIALLTFILICGALLLGVSVFFKISVVKVEGNTRYSSEQVIAASGIKAGDNLFFINKFDATSKIFGKLPYAEVVTIKRDLPNVIVINVTDAVPAAAFQTADGFWLMDKSFKLLEKTSQDKTAGAILVAGATLSKPEAGHKADLGDSGKQNCLTQILGELGSRNMLKSVKKIDITNTGDIKFDYLGRLNIKLGNTGDIKGKLDLLQNAINSKQISSVATGTIDLSTDKEAHFIPD